MNTCIYYTVNIIENGWLYIVKSNVGTFIILRFIYSKLLGPGDFNILLKYQWYVFVPAFAIGYDVKHCMCAGTYVVMCVWS